MKCWYLYTNHYDSEIHIHTSVRYSEDTFLWKLLHKFGDQYVTLLVPKSSSCLYVLLYVYHMCLEKYVTVPNYNLA